MRKRLVFAMALLSGGITAGCFDVLGDGHLFPESSGGASGTGGSGTGGMGTGGTTTSTSTSTTASPDCVPSGNSNPVDNGCGIFVSSSKGDDMAGDGSKDKPVATLTKGIELAGKAPKPVYMCGEKFMGPIKISGGALVYGALDCANGWKYAAMSRTVITAGADTIPLRVAASANVEMHDVDVTAADAAVKGGSSIAILAEGDSTLELVNSDVEAGLGAAGEDAVDMPGTGADGTKGVDGANACTAAQVITGNPPATMCGQDQSIGGAGGDGGSVSGGDGGAGDPGSGTNMNGGRAEDQAFNCGLGKDGTAGASGMAGPGASGSLGALDPDKGFTGVPGTDGESGKPGQGGGGGGGAKGGTGAGKCADASKAGGASGGSGGSGGCGGQGGKAGGSAGASMAVVSLGATLKFDTVKLTAKDGGRGGNGGAGQLGGNGAAGGVAGKAGVGALNDACKGGLGGKGGDGGRGGGGLGGHSVGIAYNGGAKPDTTGATITFGQPGPGGMGSGAEGNGAAGVAKDVQVF